MQSYQQIPLEAQCPVCRTNNARLLWGTNNKQAAQHFVLQEKYPERFAALESHIETLWGQKTCEIVQCDKCGFCYSYPYIAGDEKFYSLAYERTGYPQWKWEFQQTYDVLKKGLMPNARLIEVGAGDGAFVKRIADDVLPKENILCTEFSEYGRQKIEALGVKCVSEDVRNLSGAELEESFDVACLFQVLEHLDKLDPLFQKLNWLLKNGGSLFIAVPNPSMIEFNELNGALLDMPPNHTGRWNKKSFEEIGTQNGFYIQEHKIEKESFTSRAKHFVIYRLMRRAQVKGSFENRISKIKNRFLFRTLQMIGLAIHSISAIPALTKINPRQGSSQWIHFVKKQG